MNLWTRLIPHHGIPGISMSDICALKLINTCNNRAECNKGCEAKMWLNFCYNILASFVLCVAT